MGKMLEHSDHYLLAKYKHELDDEHLWHYPLPEGLPVYEMATPSMMVGSDKVHICANYPNTRIKDVGAVGIEYIITTLNESKPFTGVMYAQTENYYSTLVILTKTVIIDGKPTSINNNPTEYCYRNSMPTSKEYFWIEKGNLHCINGPARESLLSNGGVNTFSYYLFGKLLYRAGDNINKWMSEEYKWMEQSGINIDNLSSEDLELFRMKWR